MTITPYLLYEDVDAAIEFLARRSASRRSLRHADPTAPSLTRRCGSATT